jgi:hypothetical protein
MMLNSNYFETSNLNGTAVIYIFYFPVDFTVSVIAKTGLPAGFMAPANQKLAIRN